MVSFKGKSNVNPTRIAEDRRALKNVGLRDFKVYSDKEKIRGRDRDPSGLNGIRDGLDALTITSPLKACAEKIVMGKSKLDSSVKMKVRKALADVSNVRSYTLRDRSGDGTKGVKYQSGKIPYRPMATVGQSTTTASVSSRSSAMVTMRTKKIHGADISTLKKGDLKGLKIYTDKPKTMGKDNESHHTDNRNPKKPLMSARSSLPVKKGAFHVDSNDVKNNMKISEKGTGSSVKVRIGRRVVTNICNDRSYLRRRRASDGLISVMPGHQTSMDASAFSKKPLRPTGRTAVAVSGSRTKPQRNLGLKKSINGIETASKSKEDFLAKYVPKNSELVVPRDSSQGKVSSDGNNYTNANANAMDVISSTKRNRRKSFTSSLIAKSEVLRVCAEAVKPEELPNIDDSTNHLEVAEYVDDLYQYYWVMEAQNQSLANCMVIQTELTPKMRGILINWLVEVHHKFELMQETLFLMVVLFDRFLSILRIEKNDIQLVGLTALLLASKYEDFWHPKVKELISISSVSYTRDQMLAMEKLILKKLMFRLNAPTPYVFMLRFLKASQSDSKLEQLAFYLIELCLVEYEALKFKSSLLCASAIYVARCTLQLTPAWTPLLEKHTRYTEPQLRVCANTILRFHKAAGRGPLKVSYEKFLRSDRSSVAAIKPLDRLPDGQ